MTEVVVFQNCFTPYRHALFEEIGAQVERLTVVYNRRPSQVGRRWEEVRPTNYESLVAPNVGIGPFVFFVTPLRLLRRSRQAVFVLHDDNPANLAMIFWAIVLRLLGATTLLWCEHTQTEGGGVKLRYQKLCSWLLNLLSSKVLAFSKMSREYVLRVAPQAKICAMVQSVPAPENRHERVGGTVRRFGFIGSEEPRKNLAVLLAAFREVGQGTLHVAGVSGRKEEALISWWGYVEGQEREAFFDNIDMLILPSLREPWGLVVNEALERGALAMVSSVCGSREFVERIDPALVFEPSVEGIKGAIAHWFGRNLDDFRRKADEAVGEYSTEKAASLFLSAIGDL